MTEDERILLKAVAGWVAAQDAAQAKRNGTTTKTSDEICRLLTILQEQQPR